MRKFAESLSETVKVMKEMLRLSRKWIESSKDMIEMFRDDRLRELLEEAEKESPELAFYLYKAVWLLQEIVKVSNEINVTASYEERLKKIEKLEKLLEELEEVARKVDGLASS